MKPKIFITRKLADEAVALLREKFDVRMWEEESVAVPRCCFIKRSGRS